MKLVCEVCDKEYSPSECKYKADIYGGMTLMCPKDCQYEEINDLEIYGTTTEGTVYDETHGRGKLLWWMNEELVEKVMSEE